MNSRDSSPEHTPDTLVGSATSLEEIVAALVQRDCIDLTFLIESSKCSNLPLSGGGFCDVFRGELGSGTQIAIKSLRVYDRPGREDEKQKILKRAAREIYHWSKLKHPNVLPLMGLAVFRGNMSMVSEWMNNGDLMSYIRLNPSANRVGMCIGVCEGLCYIHARGMAHGDLKAANIMVSCGGIPKIADFGNSQLKELTLKFTNTTSHSHSLRWTAPELLRDDHGPQVSKEADVYAYGMTVLEIMTGKIPYDGIGDSRVILLVAYENRPPPRPDTDIGDDLWEILNSCWAQEPTQRPNIDSVGGQVRGLIPALSDPSIAESAGDESEAAKSAVAANQSGSQASRTLQHAHFHLALGDIPTCLATLRDLPDSTPGVSGVRRRAARLDLYVRRFKDARDKDEWDDARLALEEAVGMLRSGVPGLQRSAEKLDLRVWRFNNGALGGGKWGVTQLALERHPTVGSDIPIRWGCWGVECEVARGNWSAAEAGVNDLLQLAPNAPNVLSLQAFIMFLTNKIPTAIHLAQQALRLDPDQKSAQHVLRRAQEIEQIKEQGNKCFRDGRLREAVDWCGRALEVVGQRVSEGGGGYLRAMLLSNRAIAQFKLKRLELAFEDVNASLALDPCSFSTLRTRARIHAELEHFAGAIHDYETARAYAEAQGVRPEELNKLVEETEKAGVILNQRQTEYYCKILGLNSDCTGTEIKKAYRRESMIYHPSRGGDGEKFKLVAEAHAALRTRSDAVRTSQA